MDQIDNFRKTRNTSRFGWEKANRTNVVIQLDNKSARHLFLERHALCENPGAACDRSDILQTINKIGFVQVDSIQTVERAHHLILFSRHQTYKHQMLDTLLQSDRSLFENWTHDASIIPSQFFPYWKHKFAREKTEIAIRWKKWGRKGFKQISADVVRHIQTTGPTLSRDLKAPGKTKKSESGWWDWHPSKTALEYLWRTGETAICHRQGFQKAYDMAENVIPAPHYIAQVTSNEFQNWACASALERLGFATHGEIAAFWNLVSPAIAKSWVENMNSELVQVEVPSFDRKTSKFFWSTRDKIGALDALPKIPPRIRILSPFDPMLRDRKRAHFLFGFDFRVEMFVPEAKRKYGYYVFPILQGDKIIGRIDMKADRQKSALNIKRVWLEEKVKWSTARSDALKNELVRLARFSNLKDINYSPGAFDE